MAKKKELEINGGSHYDNLKCLETKGVWEAMYYNKTMKNAKS